MQWLVFKVYYPKKLSHGHRKAFISLTFQNISQQAQLGNCLLQNDLCHSCIALLLLWSHALGMPPRNFAFVTQSYDSYVASNQIHFEKDAVRTLRQTTTEGLKATKCERSHYKLKQHYLLSLPRTVATQYIAILLMLRDLLSYKIKRQYLLISLHDIATISSVTKRRDNIYCYFTDRKQAFKLLKTTPAQTSVHPSMHVCVCVYLDALTMLPLLTLLHGSLANSLAAADITSPVFLTSSTAASISCKFNHSKINKTL